MTLCTCILYTRQHEDFASHNIILSAYLLTFLVLMKNKHYVIFNKQI